MQCSKCGAELGENAESCPECEAAHESPEINAVISTGEQAPDEQAPDEQAPDEAPVESSAPPPQEKSGGSKRIMKIMIPVGAVALAAIIVGVLWITGVISSGDSGGSGSPFLASMNISFGDKTGDSFRLDNNSYDGVNAGDAMVAFDGIVASTRSPLNTPPRGDVSGLVTMSPGILPTAVRPGTEHPPISATPPGGLTRTVPLQGSGSLHINGTTFIRFTPDRSCEWEIRTGDSEEFDPYLWLYESVDAYNASNCLTDDDDSGGYGNARIIWPLEAGATYIIKAGFYSDGTGSYNLFAKPVSTIPSGGGECIVDGSTTFTFIPDRTGLWEFRRYEYGDYEDGSPVMHLYDSTGACIATDFDNATVRLPIRIMITEGMPYVVHVFYNDESRLMLSVTLIEETDVLRDGSTINSNGGTFRVEAPSELRFWPNRYGICAIYTSDNGGFDPYLEVRDSHGNILQYDDDSGVGLNAIMIFRVDMEIKYRIGVGCYSGESGTYVLNVEYPQELPASGGSIRVNDATVFSFSPNRSGVWEFETTDCGSSDPYLVIYDRNGNVIASNDDDGEGYNSFISMTLTAGETYGIYAVFFESGTGSYTLNVTGR